MKKIKLILTTFVITLLTIFIAIKGVNATGEIKNVDITSDGTITWDSYEGAYSYSYGVKELNSYSEATNSTTGNILTYIKAKEDATIGSFYTVKVRAYDSSNLIAQIEVQIRYNADSIYFMGQGEPAHQIIFDFNGGKKGNKTKETTYWIPFGWDMSKEALLEGVTVPTGKELEAVTVNGIRKELGSGLMIDQNYTIKYLWKNKVKKTNPMTVKAKNKTVKYKKVKKKKQKVSAITVKNNEGTVTYEKINGSKKLTVDKKTGKITVKKKTKKGTYKIKIKVTANGNNNYNSLSKTVTVKIKVK